MVLLPHLCHGTQCPGRKKNWIADFFVDKRAPNIWIFVMDLSSTASELVIMILLTRDETIWNEANNASLKRRHLFTTLPMKTWEKKVEHVHKSCDLFSSTSNQDSWWESQPLAQHVSSQVPVMHLQRQVKAFLRWKPFEKIDKNWFGEHIIQLGVSKNKGTPKWMVYNEKTLLKMDGLGVPPFSEHIIQLETEKCPKH